MVKIIEVYTNITTTAAVINEEESLEGARKKLIESPISRVVYVVKKKASSKILKGLLYSYIGLVLFLTGVNAGFMKIGSVVGYSVASLDKHWLLLLIGFILGLVVILAEPAVYILTDQIETVTSGHIKKNIVMLALSIGVAFAVALSMLRIVVPEIQLWHYLLPGYLISIILTYFVPIKSKRQSLRELQFP